MVISLDKEKEQREAEQKLWVFRSRIPNTGKVGEAVYYGMAIEEYGPKASAGIAYRDLAKELMEYESKCA